MRVLVGLLVLVVLVVVVLVVVVGVVNVVDVRGIVVVVISHGGNSGGSHGLMVVVVGPGVDDVARYVVLPGVDEEARYVELVVCAGEAEVVDIVREVPNVLDGVAAVVETRRDVGSVRLVDARVDGRTMYVLPTNALSASVGFIVKLDEGGGTIVVGREGVMENVVLCISDGMAGAVVILVVMVWRVLVVDVSGLTARSAKIVFVGVCSSLTGVGIVCFRLKK